MLLMEGFWAVFWLAVVLKIPIFALLYIVWWAAREPPVPESGPGDSGGSDRDPHRGPTLPRPTRRGPHGDRPASAPRRVRAAGAERSPTPGGR